MPGPVVSIPRQDLSILLSERSMPGPVNIIKGAFHARYMNDTGTQSCLSNIHYTCLAVRRYK